MPPELEGGSHDWEDSSLPSTYTEVTYTCGTARKLAETHPDGSITYHTSQSLSCQWEQNWDPVTVLKVTYCGNYFHKETNYSPFRASGPNALSQRTLYLSLG